MRCPDCGGTHFRCKRCGNEFESDPEERILEALPMTKGRSGYAIARRVGLSKSVTYRLLKQMVHDGLIIKEPKHGGYRKPTPFERPQEQQQEIYKVAA